MKHLFILIFALFLALPAMAQEELTRERILSMSMDELAELPIDELDRALDLVGVTSVDELFAMIMNKNVSSASKEEESSFTSPLSTTVITRGEMRSYGISTIEEALKFVPGMIVQEKTNGVYDIHMRGLNNITDYNLMTATENASTLVMVDGRIVHNYGLGSPDFWALPVSIEDVERMEVVRGATSALYGPNAVNGVINIITTKPDASSTSTGGNIMVSANNMNSDVSFHKVLGSQLCVGLTANYQLRFRSRQELPLVDRGGLLYYANDESIFYGTRSYTEEEVSQMVADNRLVNLQDATGYVSLDQLSKMKQASVSEGTYTFYDDLGPQDNVYDMWDDPSIARRNLGFNAYVSYVPTDKIRLDLTGGYQKAYAQNSPISIESTGLRGQESESFYLNAKLDFYGLNILASFSDGERNFCVGTPGLNFQNNQMLQLSADYNFQLGPLSVRPGFQYQKIYFKDAEPEYYDFNGDGDFGILNADGTISFDPGEELSGYFGYYSQDENDGSLECYSPSLRLDWKLGGVRFTAALRGDKTSIPDEWNPSWLFSGNYSFNDNNHIRLIYGRSFRSPTICYTSSNYNSSQTQKSHPKNYQFVGNPESPLVHIDNFELGYRWRPTDRILLDAEFFYSKSQDYGALLPYSSVITLTSDVVSSVMTEVASMDISNLLGNMDVLSRLSTLASSRAYFKYDELPFKVNQMGVSLNLDWVITPKLIAKLNANVQQTKIDDYYETSLYNDIRNQMLSSMSQTQSTIVEMLTDLATDVPNYMSAGYTFDDFLDAIIGVQPNYTYIADIYNTLSAEQQAAFDELLWNKAVAGQSLTAQENYVSHTDITKPLGLLYGLRYNIMMNAETDEYYFSQSYAKEAVTTVDDHEHKATPSVYGMLGLIYRPVERINASIFVNHIGERTYNTYYGTQVLDARTSVNFKLGYCPVSGMELYFSGRNMFSDEVREFIYADHIGAIYSIGFSFGI